MATLPVAVKEACAAQLDKLEKRRKELEEIYKDASERARTAENNLRSVQEKIAELKLHMEDDEDGGQD